MEYIRLPTYSITYYILGRYLRDSYIITITYLPRTFSNIVNAKVDILVKSRTHTISRCLLKHLAPDIVKSIRPEKMNCLPTRSTKWKKMKLCRKCFRKSSLSTLTETMNLLNNLLNNTYVYRDLMNLMTTEQYFIPRK